MDVYTNVDTSSKETIRISTIQMNNQLPGWWYEAFYRYWVIILVKSLLWLILVIIQQCSFGTNQAVETTTELFHETNHRLRTGSAWTLRVLPLRQLLQQMHTASSFVIRLSATGTVHTMVACPLPCNSAQSRNVPAVKALEKLVWNSSMD